MHTKSKLIVVMMLTASAFAIACVTYQNLKSTTSQPRLNRYGRILPLPNARPQSQHHRTWSTRLRRAPRSKTELWTRASGDSTIGGVARFICIARPHLGGHLMSHGMPTRSCRIQTLRHIITLSRLLGRLSSQVQLDAYL